MGFLRSIKCPVFNIERLKELPDISEYTVQIGGETEKSGLYDLNELLANFKKSSVNRRLTSVSKWSVRADWQGVLWSDFLKWAEPSSDYKYLYTESWGGYKTCVRAEDLDNDGVILCTHVNGEEIEFEYGGPFRMDIPNLWGYKSCKWIKKIYFFDEYVRGTWESNGYEDSGEIQPCMVEDVNTGKFMKIKGGEVTEF